MAMAKMTISLGLLTVPIKVSPAARPVKAASFNMLHNVCHQRISMPTRCEHCKVDIPRSDTVKGFEVEDGRYAIITKDELEALEPESSKTIEITSTVGAEEVDPILFETSYFVEPEPAGRRGYKLLLAALEKEKKYAVASITMHGKEQVIIIRPYKGVLMFHSMFYQDEVRDLPECGLKGIPEVNAAELKLAQQLLQANADKFDHASYSDGYRIAMEGLLEAKRTNKAPVAKVAAKKVVAPQDDIMSLLAASIKAGPKRAARAYDLAEAPAAAPAKRKRA
jgi:DNA end-binding protein Ku